MAVTQQIEAVCDAIIAKLIAELPAKIAEINTEAGDAHQLTMPEETSITLGARSEKPYPFIAILPGPEDPPIDASGRAHWQEAVDVVCWLEDYDEEALARKLLRFKRAVREVVMHYRRPGSSFTDPVGGYGLQYAGSEPGPTFEISDSEGRYVSWTRLSFTVQQQQDL